MDIYHLDLVNINIVIVTPLPCGFQKKYIGCAVILLIGKNTHDNAQSTSHNSRMGSFTSLQMASPLPHAADVG